MGRPVQRTLRCDQYVEPIRPRQPVSWDPLLWDQNTPGLIRLSAKLQNPCPSDLLANRMAWSHMAWDARILKIATATVSRQTRKVGLELGLQTSQFNKPAKQRLLMRFSFGPQLSATTQLFMPKCSTTSRPAVLKNLAWNGECSLKYCARRLDPGGST